MDTMNTTPEQEPTMTTITTQQVVDTAADLRSEHHENPQYDRALVEMTTRLLGLSHDESDEYVARLIGVKP